MRRALTPCFLSSSFNGARLHFFPSMQLYHLRTGAAQMKRSNVPRRADTK